MANLSDSQLQAVAAWFASGATLDEIQKRLRADFDVHMTYLDLRLLVADLPQPKEEEPIAPPPEPPKDDPAPAGAASAPFAPESPVADALGEPPPTRYDLDAPDADEGLPKPDVRVEMDALTIPGTIASGDVTFSDGTKGKWYLDQMGRLGLGNCPQGYHPSPEDAALFQARLMDLLRQRGIA